MHFYSSDLDDYHWISHYFDSLLLDWVSNSTGGPNSTLESFNSYTSYLDPLDSQLNSCSIDLLLVISLNWSASNYISRIVLQVSILLYNTN